MKLVGIMIEMMHNQATDQKSYMWKWDPDNYTFRMFSATNTY